MKKCPPGVICIENITMMFVIIILCIIGYFVYKSLTDSSRYLKKEDKIIIRNQIQERNFGLFANPSYSFSNLPGDVLLNPYEPPLKDEIYGAMMPGMPFVPPGRVPVNVSTSVGAVDVGYRQYGILKPVHGSSKDNILPLMGRPVNTSRQMFQYYTISNQHNNVKLPIIVKGKSATREYGINELFSGDRVHIEGDRMPYQVTIYDNDSIRYIPYV